MNETISVYSEWKSGISLKHRDTKQGGRIKQFESAWFRTIENTQVTIFGDLHKWEYEEWMTNEEYTWHILRTV